MNESHGKTGTATRGVTPLNAGSTLVNFLDVADSLYERIGTALAEVGLSFPKYEVLAHLSVTHDAVSLGDLALGQKCARSNITQIIDRLEAEGLVRRVADPTDRRSVLAELTPEGAAMAEQGSAQLEKLRIEFDAALGPDRVELDRLLAKLR
ncbi:MAG: MarR family winged helix-turn-helix transcriptional regulator [Longimicrobiales bacterium]